MKTIPYHEIPCEGAKITIRELSLIEFTDGRRITVHQVKDHTDLIVRIRRPIDVESESLLEFRLSNDGAIALTECLLHALKITNPLP